MKACHVRGQARLEKREQFEAQRKKDMPTIKSNCLAQVVAEAWFIKGSVVGLASGQLRPAIPISRPRPKSTSEPTRRFYS